MGTKVEHAPPDLKGAHRMIIAVQLPQPGINIVGMRRATC
jgi:hypothetical protein